MKKVTKICPFNKDHTFRLQLELDHHLPNCKDAVNFSLVYLGGVFNKNDT